MSEPIPIRVTSLDWFLECGHRAHMQEEMRWPETNTVPMVRGGVVHACRAHALDHFRAYARKEKPTPFPTYEELVETGRREFVARAGGESAPWEQDLGHFMTNEQGEKVGEGAVLSEADPYIRFDLEHVLPRLAQLPIVAVEHEFRVPIKSRHLRNEYELVGHVDLLVREIGSGRLAVQDLKTGAKIQQDDADLSAQLSGYAAGVHHDFDEWPLFCLGSPRFLKTPPRSIGPGSVVEEFDGGYAVYETVTTDRNLEDVSAFLRRLEYVLTMREAGIYPPGKSGFMSPCLCCPHAFATGELRCEYVSRAGGKR